MRSKLRKRNCQINQTNLCDPSNLPALVAKSNYGEAKLREASYQFPIYPIQRVQPAQKIQPNFTPFWSTAEKLPQFLFRSFAWRAPPYRAVRQT